MKKYYLFFSLLLIICQASTVSALNNKADNYYNEGVRLYKIGKYEQALEAYNKAIELNPNDSETYVNKGGVL
ncbi:tetratricopeptide repeat protein [Rickettsia hoogstraalii]|uniref:tetratricopeptide repeat protein n=1 Tax=Rickettsia hoogstraalii TaxID=467174 RepID=UPI00058B50B6|nr:tetratricopeptide repeat protein [Rickettsia hoogstraalii]